MKAPGNYHNWIPMLCAKSKRLRVSLAIYWLVYCAFALGAFAAPTNTELSQLNAPLMAATNATDSGSATGRVATVVGQAEPAASFDLPFLTPASTNASAAPSSSERALRTKLELARHYRRTRQSHEAEPLLLALLEEHGDEWIKQQALLEMALSAQDQDELFRAQQIYAQFLNRWPNSAVIPEVLLRQGELFRQMGLNNLALAKFYAVMTSALVLKNDMADYYRHLVLRAQTEIAETHYQLGNYADAAEFFSRLLKQEHPELNRPWAQFRLIRSLAALGRNDETISQAQDYLNRYGGSPEQAEIRFHLAIALKQLSRNGEALQQVLILLKEEQALAREHPDLWAYWQQRAGNEVGNQLYGEGDYTRALEVYLALAQLDPQPAWQLPVQYQIGLTYERLAQPEKAKNLYHQIVARQAEVGTNASPALKAVIEMATWRVEFLNWEKKAEMTVRRPIGELPSGS